MPQVIVLAERSASREGEGTVMHRERVNIADFESAHFATQFVERLGWAVGDAHQVEQEATAEVTPEEPVYEDREQPGYEGRTELVHEDREPALVH